jgi:hypothetical protein
MLCSRHSVKVIGVGQLERNDAAARKSRLGGMLLPCIVTGSSDHAGTGSSSMHHFALTLDVMDAMTAEAILNWSLRLSIPCRRAIHSKSV